MIISISGKPGCGKTTVAKLLAERMNYRMYSMGALRGKMALERGLTIDELNALGEKESFTDTEVDDYQRSLGQTEDNFVIEGRLSWHFIPNSFKVFLTCDAGIAAGRVFDARKSDATRSDEPHYTNVEDVQTHLEQRTASDRLRYERYYGINYEDPGHYHLIIDSSKGNPQAIVDEIMMAIKKHS